MSDMSTTSRLDDGVAVVSVAGYVDIATAPRLAEALDAAAQSGPSAIIVSLQRCDYCDSTGLTVLLKRAQAVPNFFVAVPSESPVRRVFRIASVEDALGVVETVADAKKRLHEASIA